MQDFWPWCPDGEARVTAAEGTEMSEHPRGKEGGPPFPEGFCEVAASPVGGHSTPHQQKRNSREHEMTETEKLVATLRYLKHPGQSGQRLAFALLPGGT